MATYIHLTRDEAILLLSQGEEIFIAETELKAKISSRGLSAVALAVHLSRKETAFYKKKPVETTEGSFFVKEHGTVKNVRVRATFETGKEPHFEVVDWGGYTLRPAVSLTQAIVETTSSSIAGTTTNDRTLLAKSDAAAERARTFFKQHSMFYRTLGLDTRESPAKWRVELTASGALIYANHGWAIATRHEVHGYTARKKFVDAVNEARHVTNSTYMKQHLASRGFNDLVTF